MFSGRLRLSEPKQILTEKREEGAVNGLVAALSLVLNEAGPIRNHLAELVTALYT
jgi:hypothetical protein